MAATVVSMFLLFLLPFADALITNASQGQQYNSSLSFYSGTIPLNQRQPNNQYQFLQFVLQNPKSENRYTRVAEKFTIHGLWPTNYQTIAGGKIVGLVPVINCGFKSYTLLPDLEQKLNIAWPNVYSCSKNEGFRNYQYTKHGSCTNPKLGSAEFYFKTALRLYYQAINDVINPSGIQRGISFGTQWFLQLVRNAIGGKEPLLLCNGRCGEPQRLDEVVICFDEKAATWRDCPYRDTWRFCQGNIYL